MGRSDFWLEKGKYWGRPKVNTPNSLIVIGKIISNSPNLAKMLLTDYHKLFPRISSGPSEEEKEAKSHIKAEELRRIDSLEREVFIDPSDGTRISMSLQDIMNGHPLSILFGRIRGNSLFFFKNNSFNELKKAGILKKLPQQMFFCKECGDKSLSLVHKADHKDCPHSQSEYISLYYIEDSRVKTNWKYMPPYFLEYFCYSVLDNLGKKFLHSVDIYKHRDLGNTNENKRETEFDFILEKEKIVILCSKNAKAISEKKQVMLAKSMGYRVFFVALGKEPIDQCDKKIHVEKIEDIAKLKEKFIKAMK